MITSQDNQGIIYRNYNSSNPGRNKSNNNVIKENPPVHNGNGDSNSRCVLDEKQKISAIGDVMLKNINGRGLIKLQSKDVWMENFPGATSLNILNKIDEHLEKKSESIVINFGTNDLTDYIYF